MTDQPLSSAPPAPTGVMPSMPPPGLPIPGQPFTVQLPPPLQEVMMQFPAVLTRLKALEDKPVAVSGPPTKLVAALAFLSGFGFLAGLVFLWNYGAVIFRL